MKRKRFFVCPLVEKVLTSILTIAILGTNVPLATWLVLGLGFLLTPNAKAAALGTSTVSAGSAPPPAATSVDSFQPDLFTGRASTGIPIAVPPGRKGMQPSLALGYSSSSRNGWLGVGWSLDLGYIERSTRKGVPKYDSTDTFTFLFQNVSSDLVKLTDGTYRAKDEGPFIKVTDLGTSGWEIRDKSGTRYLFGESAASRIGNGTNVFRWALDKVIDVNGNTMLLSYTTADSLLYLSAIQYTGNDSAGMSPANRVDFFLQDRPDVESSYRSGFLIKTSKRLFAVETRANSSLASRYELNYRSSLRTGRSLLSSVQREGTDGTTTLPPVTFAWQDATPPTYAKISNQRTNGIVGWNVRGASYDCGHDNYGCVSPYGGGPCGPANYGTPVVVSGGTSQDIFGVHVEVGTDGHIRVTGSLHDRQVHAWTAVFLSSARTVAVSLYGGWDVCCMYIEDSTGMHGPFQPGNLSFAAGWSLIHMVAYNQNDDRTDGFGLDGNLAGQVDVLNPSPLTEPQLAGDVDGNGVTDIIDFNASSGRWGAYCAQLCPLAPGVTWLSSFGDNNSLPILGDWNGDGRTDVAIYNSSGNWRFATSTGSNFVADTLPALAFGPGSPLTGDFNGGGTMDIGTFDFGTWRVATGTGTNFASGSNFVSQFTLGLPPPLPSSQVAWRVRTAGWDISNDNYGCEPPQLNRPPYGPFVTISGNYNFNGVSVSVGDNGSISVNGGLDYYAHATTAVYVRHAKTIHLTVPTHDWDVACLWIEDPNGQYTQIQQSQFGNISLSAGWSRIHIVGYNQNQGFAYYLPDDIVSQVDVMDPDITTLPSRPLQQLTGDFNGDGLTDIAILETNQLTIAYSDGSTFQLQSPVTINGMPTNGVQSADFNGDGLSDLAFYDATSGRVMVAYNTNGGFASPVNLSPTLTFAQGTAQDQMQVADFNGDSLPDPAVLNATTDDSEIAMSQGGSPDLLTGITNGLGGATAITYIPASALGQNFLPFLTPVVTETHVSDGLGNSYTNTYNYSQGFYDSASKEFRGFGRVEVRDADGNLAVTQFYQDDRFKGRPFFTEFRDLANAVWTRTTNLWEVVQPYPGVPANFVRLAESDSFTFDGTTTSKQTRNRIFYDAVGNVTTNFSDGDLAVTGDERSTVTTYTLNTTDWILNRPAQVQSLDASGAVVAQRRFYYDNAGSTAAAPAKGNLTREEEWLDRDRSGLLNRWIGTTMSYDGFGNVVTVTDALGHSVTNAYDSATATFLTQVANPLGHTRTMIYDPRFGQVMSSTDQNGVATSSEYDVLGRITKVIGPLDTSALPTSRYDYDLSAVPTRVTQYTRVQSGQAQEVVSHTFTDGLGRTIQVRSPAQNATKQVVTGTVEFDSKGRVVRQWTPYLDTGSSTYRPHTLPDIAPLLAPPVVHTYDPLGRLLTTTDPDGSSTSIAYDHWTVTTSDAKQHVKKRTSDAFGRLVQVQEFEGTGTNATLYATTSYQYDSRDNLVLLTDAVGNTTSLQYDSLNRKIQMTDPDMGTWTYAYDDVDKLASQTDARGVSILFTYDALNRQTRKDYLIPPNINVPTNQPPVLYIYDNPLKQFSKGKLTEIADASGSSSFAYDTLGRLVTEQKTVDATTYTIQRAYDLLGRLTTLTYPNNDVATYAYNDQGGIQTITLQSPAQPVQPIINSVDYNAAGQITKMVYGNGVTTDYTYNPQTLRLDKLKSVGPGGVLQDFTYSFDSVGNVSAIADAVHTASQSFTYDSLNRLATANGARYGSFAYTYNQIGNMTGKEGVTQNYGPQNNRPHAVTATSAGLALTYDANGNLASKSGPNRPAQTFVFDAENRLVEVGSPTPYRKLDPGWNLVSFPQIVGEAPVTAALTNFAGNCEQLTRFNTRSNWFESFVNLPGTDQFNTLSATNGYALFVTNAAGIYLPLGDTPAPAGPRLLPAGTNFLAGPSDIMSATNWLAGLVPGVDYDQVLGLDPNTGSTAPVTAVRPGEAYYVRMLRATNWTPPTAAHVANPSTVRFVYDGDGGRVKKIAWKGTTLFLSQSFEASREGHTTTYIMAGGLRIAAKESGGSLRIYHSDHLGSANIVTDGLGLAAELTENTPFGSTSRDEGLVNVAHKFTGQRFDDETGLYYYGARYYDQDLGRFISPDSLVQAPFTPQSLNRYSYCVNSPIQNVDPSGHFWFVALIIGAIIGAAAGAIQSYNLTGHVTFGAVAFGALQGALAGATLGSSAAELGFGYQLAQAAAVVSFGSQIAGAAGNYSLQSQLQQISTGLNIAYGAAQVGEGIRTWLHEPGFKLENANTGETIDALHNHDHLFVPGVNTPEDLARSQATGGKFGVNNVLVNNPRHGLIADVTEAALEKFVGPSSVTKQLAEKMTGLSGITLTGYSQGGIISASTAEVLASEGQAGVISRLTVVNTQVSAATFYQAARSIGLNRDNAIYRSGSMWDFSNFLAPSLNAKTFLGGAVGTALLPFGIHNHGQIPPLPSQ